MANINCEACEELRQVSPELIANGFDDEMCTSLENDTGLAPGSGNNDCTDLHNMNDCLVGNMETEVEAYDICDWKKFMRKFIPNLWTVLTAMVCAICGIWKNVHAIWEKIEEIIAQLNKVSYIGILTLYTTTQVQGSGSGNQVPPFNTYGYQGNIAYGDVLSVASGYRGIRVTNTTNVPLLVECTFNCSIRTGQNFACCFIVVTRDGLKVGQTPFITPTTYDQQVMAEPFILNPGQSTTLGYYFRIGNKNDWFRSEFGGGDLPQCTLEPNDPYNPENQRSYFNVRVTSVVAQMSQ